MVFTFLCHQWRNSPNTNIVSSGRGANRRTAGACNCVKPGLAGVRADSPRVARTVCRLWDGQGGVLPRKCTSIAELPLAGALFIVYRPAKTLST